MRSQKKASALGIFSLIIRLLVHAVPFQPKAVASPVAGSLRLVKLYRGTLSGKDGIDGPDQSDYPTDDEIRAAYTSPQGPFIFFSQTPDSAVAYEFAQSKGGVIFREAFQSRSLLRIVTQTNGIGILSIDLLASMRKKPREMSTWYPTFSPLSMIAECGLGSSIPPLCKTRRSLPLS